MCVWGCVCGDVRSVCCVDACSRRSWLAGSELCLTGQGGVGQAACVDVEGKLLRTVDG